MLKDIIKAWIEKSIQVAHKNQNHICRFNDGDQTCDCYNQALDDLTSRIPQLEEMIKREIMIQIGKSREWYSGNVNEPIRRALDDIINTLSQKEG